MAHIEIEWWSSGKPQTFEFHGDSTTIKDCEAFVEAIKEVLSEQAKREKEEEK